MFSTTYGIWPLKLLHSVGPKLRGGDMENILTINNR